MGRMANIELGYVIMGSRIPETLAIATGLTILLIGSIKGFDQDPGSVGAIMCWSGIILGSLMASVAIGALTNKTDNKCQHNETEETR